MTKQFPCIKCSGRGERYSDSSVHDAVPCSACSPAREASGLVWDWRYEKWVSVEKYNETLQKSIAKAQDTVRKLQARFR